MQRQEFEELALAHTIPELQPYIPMVIEMLGGTIRYERFELANVVEINGRLASLIESQQIVKSQNEQSESKVKPSVTSEFLLDQITPWVEDVRQELFNSRVAPFSTIEQADKWLEEGKKSLEQRFRVDIETLLKTKPKRKAERKPPKERWPFIDYAFQKTPGYYPPYIVCTYRSFEMGYATGFRPVSLVYYILANFRPILRKVHRYVEEEKTILPSGASLVNRLVTVQIRGELDFDELYRLYKQIREDLGIKRTRSLNKKHLELYMIVSQKGGAPEGKGTVAFWESVKQEMNKWIKRNRKGDQYTTWKGVKRAYDLLCDKLKSRYLVEGGKGK